RRTLPRFTVRGERRGGRIGGWVVRPGGPEGGEDKIAAVGVRGRHWVRYHGVALNIEPDLEHFHGIVPCGVDPEVSGHGVTSLARLGVTASMQEVDMALRATFDEVFAEPTACVPPAVACT